MTIRPCLLRRASMLAFAGLLTACSVLPEAQTLAVYRLPAASTQAPAGGLRTDWSLRVDTPQSSGVTDSVRILVMRDANRISAYQGVRWSDTAPVLLRNRLMLAFTSDNSVGAVSSDDANLQADVVLGADLRAFQVEYQDGSPVVVLRLDARLVQASTRRIIAAQTFDVRQTVDGTQVPEVVVAFGKAGDQLAARVKDWTVSLGRQRALAEQRPPPHAPGRLSP